MLRGLFASCHISLFTLLCGTNLICHLLSKYTEMRVRPFERNERGVWIAEKDDAVLQTNYDVRIFFEGSGHAKCTPIDPNT